MAKTHECDLCSTKERKSSDYKNYCDNCRRNLINGSYTWTGRFIGDNCYCLTCFPLMVDVFIAENKLKKFLKCSK